MGCARVCLFTPPPCASYNVGVMANLRAIASFCLFARPPTFHALPYDTSWVTQRDVIPPPLLSPVFSQSRPPPPQMEKIRVSMTAVAEKTPLTKAVVKTATPTTGAASYNTFGSPNLREVRISYREERARILGRLDVLDLTNAPAPTILDIVLDHKTGRFGFVLDRLGFLAEFAKNWDVAPPLLIDTNRLSNDMRGDTRTLRVVFSILAAGDRRPGFVSYLSLEHKRVQLKEDGHLFGKVGDAVAGLQERDLTFYVLVYNRLETRRNLAHQRLHPPLKVASASDEEEEEKEKEEDTDEDDSDFDYSSTEEDTYVTRIAVSRKPARRAH